MAALAAAPQSVARALTRTTRTRTRTTGTKLMMKLLLLQMMMRTNIEWLRNPIVAALVQQPVPLLLLLSMLP
jgi:hypothetical protein